MEEILFVELSSGIFKKFLNLAASYLTAPSPEAASQVQSTSCMRESAFFKEFPFISRRRNRPYNNAPLTSRLLPPTFFYFPPFPRESAFVVLALLSDPERGRKQHNPKRGARRQLRRGRKGACTVPPGGLARGEKGVLDWHWLTQREGGGCCTTALSLSFDSLSLPQQPPHPTERARESC